MADTSASLACRSAPYASFAISVSIATRRCRSPVFNPSREAARRFFTDAWNKYRNQQPTTALERIAAGVIAAHPQYQAIVEAPEHNLERDWPQDGGDVNPFLHLSLHLALAEQLSIDQPPGICAAFQRIRAKHGDEHAALHAMVECLREVMWIAQQHGTAPDAALYLACLAR